MVGWLVGWLVGWFTFLDVGLAFPSIGLVSGGWFVDYQEPNHCNQPTNKCINQWTKQETARWWVVGLVDRSVHSLAASLMFTDVHRLMRHSFVTDCDRLMFKV